jgi:hypothetical protein
VILSWRLACGALSGRSTIGFQTQGVTLGWIRAACHAEKIYQSEIINQFFLISDF